MSGPTESELQLQIHQRLLDELSQGHQAFETHIDLLEDVIFRCTRSGVFTLLNPAWARLLGWSVDTTLGTPITEFMADQDAAAALLQAMAQNDSISCDVKLGSRYGLTRQFRLRAKFNGEWYGSLQDVTDMLNVIAELHESQRQSRKLSQVASRTDNLVIITDADGVIEWVNQSFETVTGYTMSEVRGRRPGDFLQGANTPAQTIRLMSEGIRNAKGFTAEVINYTKAGKPYWISIDCSPVFDRDNKLINFIAIERDISEQKNLENLLR